jgi:hypothetical protein
MTLQRELLSSFGRIVRLYPICDKSIQDKNGTAALEPIVTPCHPFSAETEPSQEERLEPSVGVCGDPAQIAACAS